MLGIIGDLVQDIVVWTLEDLRYATDTHSQITTTRGGSAANVAAFAGSRCQTRFIGCVGDDLTGQILTQELQSHGVETQIQTANLPTGIIVVLIDQMGERMMFPSRGASSCIDTIDKAYLDDLSILHLTGYSFQDESTTQNLLEAADHVRTNGGTISFDVSSTGMIDLFGASRFQQLMQRLAPDYISANEEETQYLALADADGAGPFLKQLGNTTLLARAGADSTRIFENKQLIAQVPVPPVPNARDFTGAGDAFNAGFLTALQQGHDHITACRKAHALSRLVLSNPGASDTSDTS